jgi:hypothetical protein
MKKLVFMFVAFAAISLASCGNKSADKSAAKDSDSIAAAQSVDTTKKDSAATDSAAAKAPADSAAQQAQPAK